ncbi:MAG: TRAP transporter large permease subunit [Deltaproteobacteria bacterium]|nr:TRAP transporter large permease subunit [Deltaproteobacteria bacterium]
MVLLPLVEIVARKLFGIGVPGSAAFTQHLTLWVGFLGAALAATEGKLLALATGELIPKGRFRSLSGGFAGAVAAGISTLLFWACFDLIVLEREAETMIAAGVPVWIGQLAMPIGFGLIAVRLVWRSSARWPGRLLALAAIGVATWIARHPELLEFRPAWPGLLILLVATLLGGPIFAAIGGFAVLLFMAEGVPAAAVPAETYRLVVSPTLPAIPLFTLAGFLLAEGKSSTRLLRVFRAFFGWMPGGTAVVCAVVCAFFTAFTGGSGVTILALGGLLFHALQSDGYREEFSLGLLTASGSLGLLFPPALPLILYAIVAKVPIEDLFIGGLIPGLLLVLLLVIWGVREGWLQGARRIPFEGKEAGKALWQGKWELLLPVVVLIAIFSGWATPVEASAVAALYALVVQAFVHRDLSLTQDLPRVLRHCTVLVGGVLIILGVAMGLTNYLVDAQVPTRVVDWAQGHISSPLVFLLALNVFLLLVGCLMDIFSAIVVVVPLIVPLGVAFGIHPVHLGIIFVANLELGYLTPPVGLNLFLASYRFEKPLLLIYRAALPMLLILGVGVLLITYVPGLTTGLLTLLGRG